MFDPLRQLSMLRLLCLLFALVAVHGKPFPLPPTRYFVELSLESPQWTSVGLPRVAVPIKAWVDNEERRERLEYYPDADPWVSVVSKALLGYRAHVSYMRETKRVCEVALSSTFSGLASVFPSHTTGWAYNGTNGAGVDIWTRNVPQHGANNNFTFGANATTGTPIFYEYVGFTSTTAGYLLSPNYDWFRVQYSDFKPGYFNSSVFEAPCAVDSTTVASSVRTRNMRGGFDVEAFRRLHATEATTRAYEPLSKSEAELPAEVDWVAKGKVFPVKDQGDCGCCWSFGSTAAGEISVWARACVCALMLNVVQLRARTPSSTAHQSARSVSRFFWTAAGPRAIR